MSAGYVAHFEGLDAEKLFAIEDEANDCDAPRDYIEGLLVILAEWRRHIERCPYGRGEYERALNATREAWLLWSFRWEGGPQLPDTFDLPRRRGGARS